MGILGNTHQIHRTTYPSRPARASFSSRQYSLSNAPAARRYPLFPLFNRRTRIHRLPSNERLAVKAIEPALSGRPVCTLPFPRFITMASFMRPTILRQAAMSRAAFAQPAVRSSFIRAATMHTTSKRPAILPPGPRKLIEIGRRLMCAHRNVILLTCWLSSSSTHRGWRYDSHQYIAT